MEFKRNSNYNEDLVINMGLNVIIMEIICEEK